MPRNPLVCSVCDEKITRAIKDPVILVNSLKVYDNWAQDAGNPPIRRNLALCPKHVGFMLNALKEMRDERERLAIEQDDRPGGSA